MPALISELIVSLDNHARGTRSPAYYGYSGPEFDAWIKTNAPQPHGSQDLQALALPPEARDEGWQKSTKQPGFLFSRTLKSCDGTRAYP